MRFYAESDGDKGNMSFYVVDKYADPLRGPRRTDFASMKLAREMAKRWNESPPWPVWDLIQAERDGYHPTGFRDIIP